eukprot:Rmarinus@m.928
MVNFRVECVIPMPAAQYWVERDTTEFRVLQCEVLSLKKVELLEEYRENGEIVQVVRTIPNMELPSAVKSLLGGKEFVFDDTLRRPAQTGPPYECTFVSNPPVLTDRTKVSGRLYLKELDGGSCLQVLEGTATVSIFGIGGIVERTIVHGLKDTYAKLPIVVCRWNKLRRKRNLSIQPAAPECAPPLAPATVVPKLISPASTAGITKPRSSSVKFCQDPEVDAPPSDPMKLAKLCSNSDDELSDVERISFEDLVGDSSSDRCLSEKSAHSSPNKRADTSLIMEHLLCVPLFIVTTVTALALALSKQGISAAIFGGIHDRLQVRSLVVGAIAGAVLSLSFELALLLAFLLIAEEFMKSQLRDTEFGPSMDMDEGEQNPKIAKCPEKLKNDFKISVSFEQGYSFKLE